MKYISNQNTYFTEVTIWRKYFEFIEIVCIRDGCSYDNILNISYADEMKAYSTRLAAHIARAPEII